MTVSQSRAHNQTEDFRVANAAELLARAVVEADSEQVSERHWQNALLGPLRDFLSRPGSEFRGSIVASAWAVAGRDLSEMPGTLPIALELLHAGSLIIDDIQDQSEMRRGQPALHHRYGVPVALNTGNWLYFAAGSLIDNLDVSDVSKLALLRRLRSAVLRCHQGQALDLSTRISSLPLEEIRPIVVATTTLKTASLVELAAALGATAAGATDQLLQSLERFGNQLGTALQTLDDLSGVLTPRRYAKGEEDLRGGRPTWVWVLASQNSSRSALSELLKLSEKVENGDSPISLREQLAAAIPADARSTVSQQLSYAYQRLCAEVPTSAGLSSIQNVIERLEKSYV